MASGKLEWKVSQAPVPYPEAVAAMEARVAAIIAGEAPEMVWLLEHPPLYTGGTSADKADLLDHRLPFYETGRGGQITYHGPGQRIAYVMLDLKKRDAQDVRAYVQNLEQWLINTLARFGVQGFTREGRVGVWVTDDGWRMTDDEERAVFLSSAIRHPSSESKIAALGIRVRKWVTFHGIALNICPDLIPYRGIVPCGIRGYGITSLKKLGIATDINEVDTVLKEEFIRVFG